MMRGDAHRSATHDAPRAARERARGPRTTTAAASARALTGLQAESWRLLWQQLLRDADALSEMRIWEERRRRASPEMLALLRRFLDGAADLAELRAAVDRGTRGEWDAFGMRGASGAMFLNRLAKHAGDAARVTSLLRGALAKPHDDADARERLATLMRELPLAAGADAGAAAATPPLQPARAVFFTSVWWHLQEGERWPIFQPSARRALREEQDVFVAAGDAAADYTAFRDAFLSVADALRASAWELEYLCWWRQQQRSGDEPADVYYEPGALRTGPATVREPPQNRRPAPPAPPRTAPHAPPALQHTHVQYVLARIGRKLGFRVWVAANDRSRSWEGHPLSELTVRRLPTLGLTAASQGVVAMIDVVWLRGANEVVAAFEIEHTTSVYSGLLRLADLAALSPNLRFPLYIVAPRSRLAKVRRELQRPAMQALGLHLRCAFLAGEALLDAADSIMRWATDASAIDKLAARVDEHPVTGERAD